jgi:uncharacterized protein
MSLQKSSYVIEVELDGTVDRYMLFHGYTGAIDIVSGKVISYLNHIEEQQSNNSQVSDTVQKALKTRGYLTNKTTEEEEIYVKVLARAVHKQIKSLHKGFGFVIS